LLASSGALGDFKAIGQAQKVLQFALLGYQVFQREIYSRQQKGEGLGRLDILLFRERIGYKYAFIAYLHT